MTPSTLTRLTTVPDNLFLINNENELLATGKRPTKRKLMIAVTIVLGIPFLIIPFAIIAAVGVQDIYDDYVFNAAEHQTTTAYITQAQRNSCNTSIEEALFDPCFAISVSYEFTVNNQRYRRHAGVTDEAYSRIQANDTLTVTYVVDNPSLSRLEGDTTAETNQESLQTFLNFGLLFALVMGYVVFRQWKKRRGGSILVGRIIDCAGKSEKVDGFISEQYQLTVDYEFTTPAGEIVRDTAQQNRNDLRDKPLPLGRPVAVLYHPQNGHELL